ncbi:hypothetical protein ACQ9LF_12590 [Anaerohalosphaeraceae bacterium U12dextr]
MKKYEDERISFFYPEEFKITDVKSKYGSYTLIKRNKKLYITIDLISSDAIGSVKRVIQSQPPPEVSDTAKVKYMESVVIGEKQGIGHFAETYDHSRNLWGKIYRILFKSNTGGLYIEISSREDFIIDSYKDILESIKVKE